MDTPRTNTFIGIVTERIREAADFYIQHFGYTINAETTRFIVVQAPNQKRVIGFSLPSIEKGLTQTFQGGLHLPFLVENADEALRYFETAGVAITRGIKIEAWGEKHFVITDPAGLELYISEALQISTPQT